jgi:DNA-binding transcriptional LysR family regulator
MDAHVRDLRYFLAVAEAASFTAAAERLFVSQPALSKQVRALEKNLGHVLLCRDSRGICLTPAGADFLPRAREVVERWDAALAALGEHTHRLVLGMQTSPGRNLLPRIRAGLPEPFEFELRQIRWDDASCGLADRSTDAAFCWLPLPEPSAYRWLTLARERRVVAMADTHPLARRESVTFAEIADEPILALPESAGLLRDHFLAVPERNGVPPVIAGIISDPESTYEAVAGGRGICLLAEGNAPVLARGCVTMVPVDDLAPSELVLAWRADATSPALSRFIRTSAKTVGPDAAHQ